MMAVWSEVNVGKLELSFRIDPEYYQPYFLHMLDIMRKRGAVQLCPSNARIRKTKFIKEKGSAFDYIEISRVSTTLGTYDSIKIYDEDTPSRAQYVVKPGDVLVSEVRPNRSAIALVPDGIGRTVCSSGFAVIEAVSVSAEFLFVYFKCNLITNLLIRDTTATMYPAVSDDDISCLPFIKPDAILEESITQKVKDAFSNIARSKELYAQAERLLLSELNLGDLDLTPTLFYERPFSETQQATRLDAEFFQPSYQKVIDTCSAYKGGAETLATLLLSMTNGVECRTFVEEGVPYIRVGDMGKLRIRSSDAVRISAEDASRLYSKIALRKGDVLTARSGSIGQACVVTESDHDSILSSHLMRLRPRKNCPLLSNCLALFLSTTPGILQVIKNGNGGIVPEISQPFMKRIIVPIFDKHTQERLSDLIQESQQAEDEARRLLNEAKRMVEEAVLGGSR